MNTRTFCQIRPSGAQEVTLAQHVNYCFVPGGRVFSSANRHFFQLIFVVNQIKV